ncbi:D-alanine--D-alanine ligase [Clostridium cylindrosporum]|uniref:D-alanine--D-alanine ligase n=1 Tax=Clostridium cylindrosporum DSM 605 TaxID=1121307 RepID=A0A0J8D9B0_CLOCY|nr:D-alanine--D-alanine ligase [Clostridium cylindrosporum]KMT20873.1 D-alanine--D-alanine ligase A [Clostridium cylindrosporum DSM 605]
MLKIGVLMGGISSEREISLRSGNAVCEHLDKSKYNVVPIVLDSKDDVIEKVKGIDFAFLALHGKFGEDGVVQGVLETLNIPYSGCGVLASSLCMDKDMTKKVLRFEGINTADWTMVSSVDDINYEKIKEIGYPVFVKPNSGGSSFATVLIKEEKDIESAVVEALKYDTEVMIEKYIKGYEISCPVIEGKMFPIVAIEPSGEFFDFTSKYTDGGAKEFVVEFEEDLQGKIEKMVVGTFKALKCNVYARVDIIISEGELFVLEVNTLPGMTSNSLFPKSAAHIGISYSDLIEIFIEKSLNLRGNIN